MSDQEKTLYMTILMTPDMANSTKAKRAMEKMSSGSSFWTSAYISPRHDQKEPASVARRWVRPRNAR